MFRNRWYTVAGLLLAFGLIGVPSAPAQDGRAHYAMGHVAAELGDASKLSDCQNWIRELARSSHLTPNQARELTLSAEAMTLARAEAGN